MAATEHPQPAGGSANICKRCDTAAATLHIRAELVCEYDFFHYQETGADSLRQEVLYAIRDYKGSEAYRSIQTTGL